MSATLIAAALAFAGASSARAASGDLDPSFGTGGRVTAGFGGGGAAAHAVAIQADGRIVAAGGATQCCVGGDFELARFDADGSLDESFGAGGKVLTDFGFFDEAWAVAVQADGRIIAAGGGVGGENDFKLARYEADGSLDPSFGTGGRVMTDFGVFSQDVALAVAIQSDGKIVAAGTGAQGSFALARYDTDGTLDETFGAGGKVTTRFPGGFGDTANAVALQTDGKIVAAGATNQGEFGLARYNTDGSVDAGFGTSGTVTTRFRGFFNRGRAVAIQPDAKIVVAGSDGIDCFALARFDTDGALDASFGVDGKVITSFGCGSGLGAAAIVVQRNGKIVAAGGDQLDFNIARFAADGSPDTSFGAGGTVTTDFGGGFSNPRDLAFGVAIQSDGKLVAAGVGGADCCGGGATFALARYLADPLDGAPPVITTPTGVTADATGPGGAVVSYTASATDDVDGPVAVACWPSSGSMFPIGTTTVACRATDAAGNSASAGFDVRVKGGAEQLDDLFQRVVSESLGPGTSLPDKLRDARAALARGDRRAACEILGSFVKAMEAQNGKKLTQAQRDELVGAASRIRAVLGC